MKASLFVSLFQDDGFILSPPSNLILDNFNRADSLSLGSDWSLINPNSPRIFSARCRAPSAGSVGIGAYWNGSTYGPDGCVFATIGVGASDPNSVMSIIARVNGIGGSLSGYELAAMSWSGSVCTQLKLYEVGTGIPVAPATTVSLSAGDKFGLRMVGATFTICTFTEGSWVAVAQHTSSYENRSGYVGIGGWASAPDETMAWDDFGIGEPDYLPSL